MLLAEGKFLQVTNNKEELQKLSGIYHIAVISEIDKILKLNEQK
jgi:hypothetical protein